MSIPFWPEYQVEVADGLVNAHGRKFGQCMIRTRYPVDESHKFTDSEVEAGFTVISMPMSFSLHEGPEGASPGDVVSAERSKAWLEAEGSAEIVRALVEDSVGAAAWEKMKHNALKRMAEDAA